MRPNLIELLSPAVERPLLGPMISFRERLYLGTDVAMHSLVTAIVLRAPRPRADDGDSKSDPPCR
jgi:hypothetical protein